MTMTDAQSTNEARRVAITGMGVATALGFEVSAFWEALLAGRSGIRVLQNIPGLEDAGIPRRIGGEVDHGQLEAVLSRYRIKDSDRCTQLGLYTAGRALEDAGFSTDGQEPLDLETIAATGHGTILWQNQSLQRFLERGYRALRPTCVVRAMFNRLSSVASMHFRLVGANHVVSSACASGSVALGDAFRQVRAGFADGVLVVSADSGMDLPTFAAWNRLGVLSRNPDPEAASRPFDRARDGLVMGEGAAAFVVESFGSARRRGARIRAEIMGYGSSSDATHIVQPDPEGQARAIRRALDSAGVTPEQVDYVNAHGTGTRLADEVEAGAVHRALGTSMAARVPVSSIKGQIGHLMGATAAVEMVAAVAALESGRIPANHNLDDPDPTCDLRFVRGSSLEADLRVVLKNTFAFGGNNSVLVLGRP